MQNPLYQEKTFSLKSAEMGNIWKTGVIDKCISKRPQKRLLRDITTRSGKGTCKI